MPLENQFFMLKGYRFQKSLNNNNNNNNNNNDNNNNNNNNNGNFIY